MNTSLTPSQQCAYDKLAFFGQIAFSGVQSVCGISPRPFPLLIGASGSGKTHIVKAFSRKNGCPLFSINAGNWIPRGAKADSQITFDQLHNFINANEAGIILIDELNKLRKSHTDNNSWSSDIFSELIALLDRDSRLENMGLKGLITKLKRNFIIIGAAAFQDEWKESESGGASIGFAGKDETSETREARFEKMVQTNEVVPDELLFRFNDRVIIIPPPTQTEFAERISFIRKELNLAPLHDIELNITANKAAASGKMMRWLEGYLTGCLTEVSSETLSNFADKSEIHPDIAPEPEENAAMTSPQFKQITKRRDACYDEYCYSMKQLAAASVRLALPLGPILSNAKWPDEADIEQNVLDVIRNLAEPIWSENREADYREVILWLLNYVSDKALQVRRCTIDDTLRGKYSTHVRDISRGLYDTFPILLDYCLSVSGNKDIYSAAADFGICTKEAHTALAELIGMDRALAESNKN